MNTRHKYISPIIRYDEMKLRMTKGSIKQRTLNDHVTRLKQPYHCTSVYHVIINKFVKKILKYAKQAIVCLSGESLNLWKYLYSKILHVSFWLYVIMSQIMHKTIFFFRSYKALVKENQTRILSISMWPISTPSRLHISHKTYVLLICLNIIFL
jgi:hypothetical protein